MKRVERSAIVEYRCLDLYALVEDIESYPRFLPWCLAAEVRERSPGRTVATLTVGLRGIRQAFTTENENRPPSAIDMRLREGPFRRFGATWRFAPLAERAARQAEHEARVKAEAIAARAQAEASSTEAFIAHLKLEIEKLRREIDHRGRTLRGRACLGGRAGNETAPAIDRRVELLRRLFDELPAALALDGRVLLFDARLLGTLRCELGLAGRREEGLRLRQGFGGPP